MTIAILLFAILFLIGVIIGYVKLKKRRRRSATLLRPLPEEWRQILETDFPRYNDIPPEIRATLDGYLQVLMDEKNFEACGELEEITDQIKLLICAQAALLLVRLDKHHFYGRLKYILVYPSAFRDRGHRLFGIEEEAQRGANLGESWQTGSVVLAWDSVLSGARNSDDGQNVVIHEFAHQLDQIDGVADGVPILKDRAAYQHWAKTFIRNYDDLVHKVETGKGHRGVMDTYGATNPAEFFAVASESFFEEPDDLKEKRADLYDQLKIYYGLDPFEWRAKPEKEEG